MFFDYSVYSVCFVGNSGRCSPAIKQWAHGTHGTHGMNTLINEKETYRILGACFKVYKEKGFGFLESVHQECLGLEFGLCHEFRALSQSRA